jgi:hypothetical protein
LLKRLVKDAREHGLIVFVGAGVNATAIPQWSNLLRGLLDQTIESAAMEDVRIRRFDGPLRKWCQQQFDACALASVIKHVLGPQRYRDEIQDAIYRGDTDLEKEIKTYCRRRYRGSQPEAPNSIASCSEAEAGAIGAIDARYELLFRVAELCSLPEVMGVATFNFDTLLEVAIAACGKKTPRAHFGDSASIPDEPEPEQQAGGSKSDAPSVSKRTIPVFHLHGLLSPPNTMLRNPDEGVVFSYEEYFDKNADPFSWETATPIHLLRHFCTLWIGASLKDWNMMRLLYAARSKRTLSRSYCLQCLQEVDLKMAGESVSGQERQFQEAAMRVQATLYDALGVDLIIAGPDFQDLSTVIANNITTPLHS